MKRISSAHNPLIKKVIQLKHKKGRVTHNAFTIEGVRSVITAIDSGHTPEYVYITEKYVDIIKKYNVKNGAIIIIPDTLFKKISNQTTSSGILGVFSIPSAPLPSSLAEGIVLIQLQDPGNVGTLIRTCLAFNRNSIVFIDSVDPWHPKVIQATAGLILNAQVYQWTWQELLKYKQHLLLYVLTTVHGESPQIMRHQQGLILIGSEAHGVPQKYLDSCDIPISLAMPGNIESLNAAIAGALAMYEAWIPH